MYGYQFEPRPHPPEINVATTWPIADSQWLQLLVLPLAPVVVAVLVQVANVLMCGSIS